MKHPNVKCLAPNLIHAETQSRHVVARSGLIDYTPYNMFCRSIRLSNHTSIQLLVRWARVIKCGNSVWMTDTQTLIFIIIRPILEWARQPDALYFASSKPSRLSLIGIDLKRLSWWSKTFKKSSQFMSFF